MIREACRNRIPKRRSCELDPGSDGRSRCSPVVDLVQRLASRDTNSCGKNSAERDRILKDLAQVEPLLRASATVELDTRRPLEETVDEILQIARR